MCEDGILVAEHSVTLQPRWSRDLQHSTLVLTKLNRRSDRPDLINQLVMLNSCTYTINFRSYTSNCSRDKQTLNPFYVKGTWKQWLRVACAEKDKTLSVLGITLNCVWWCASRLWVKGMWIIYSLPLLSGRLIVVLLVRVPSMVQIELFNHLLRIIVIRHLKPYSRE